MDRRSFVEDVFLDVFRIVGSEGCDEEDVGVKLGEDEVVVYVGVVVDGVRYYLVLVLSIFKVIEICFEGVFVFYLFKGVVSFFDESIYFCFKVMVKVILFVSFELVFSRFYFFGLSGVGVKLKNGSVGDSFFEVELYVSKL